MRDSPRGFLPEGFSPRASPRGLLPEGTRGSSLRVWKPSIFEAGRESNGQVKIVVML